MNNYQRTESSSGLSKDNHQFKLHTKMPTFKGAKTPYLNNESKPFCKSLNRCEFGDIRHSKYVSSEMKHKLPIPAKSRDLTKLPSDRGTENLICKCTTESTCNLHHQKYVDCPISSNDRNSKFSGRKAENIFRKHMEESNSMDSVNKTIDLEDIQREVETVKARIQHNRKRIDNSNRISSQVSNTGRFNPN